MNDEDIPQDLHELVSAPALGNLRQMSPPFTNCAGGKAPLFWPLGPLTHHQQRAASAGLAKCSRCLIQACAEACPTGDSLRVTSY